MNERRLGGMPDWLIAFNIADAAVMLLGAYLFVASFKGGGSRRRTRKSARRIRSEADRVHREFMQRRGDRPRQR